MIIFNETTKESLTNVTILLNKSEADQMQGYLEELLSNATQNAHYHLNNDDYSKEVTLTLYDKKSNLDGFSDVLKTLINSEL